jgi:site-specific DNA recombinase
MNKKNREGKTAVAYVRVSTHMQVKDGYSLESQKSRIEKYCTENKINLRKIYSDDGISGKSMSNRAGLLKMMDEIQKGETLFVMVLSRIARNHDDMSKMVKELLAKGVHDIFEVETNTKVDVYSSTGKLNFQIKASIDEYTSNQMGDVISRTMADMRSEGKLKNKPPFGWMSPAKKMPFVKCEEEQEAIRRIEELVDEFPTFSYSKLCRILDGENVPCRKAKKWYPHVLKGIHDEIKNKVLYKKLVEQKMIDLSKN